MQREGLRNVSALLCKAADDSKKLAFQLRTTLECHWV